MILSACGEAQKSFHMTDDDKAREVAKGLIQGYIGPDHQVIDIKAFYSALVQALREARAKNRRPS